MGYRYGIAPYAILSSSAVEKLHEASLDILARIGVRVPSRRILALASDHGAMVDWNEECVRLPPELTLRAIAQAGRKHVLYGRDRRKTAEFGHDMFNFNGSSGQYRVVDRHTRNRRKPTTVDLRDAIAIGESLETMMVITSLKQN
jgi:trimethylamine--corrinoid protein Co-methyltransferase